jgi:hypothetical protein
MLAPDPKGNDVTENVDSVLGSLRGVVIDELAQMRTKVNELLVSVPPG